MTVKRAVAEATELAISYGWRFWRYGTKHPLFICPCGGCRPLSAATTPGDRRGSKNFEGDLKRCPKARKK